MPETFNHLLEDSIRKDLACPRCHGGLHYAPDQLICVACKLFYPIDDGILVLIEERAKTQRL